MVWIALDLGSRRIGVAITDAGGMIAQPHTTLEARGFGSLPMEEIRRLVAERNVGGIVVGLPRRLDGSHGAEANAAEEAAERLRRELDVRVELWDERLSSAQAERMLIDAGVKRRRRKGATDRVAAALILQGFLAANPGNGGATA